MIIGIPVYQGVDLLDVTGPHEVFSWMEEPFEIRVIAASTTTPIVARDGFSFNASHTFDQTPDLDVLWVPGGDPPVLATMINASPPGDYIKFLIDRGSRATWVCSVCEGALLLAATGLLDGFKATTHWLFKPCLASYQKITVVEGFPRFVQDRNRLTGGGISSGLDESLELVRLLQGDDVAHGIQRTLQYYPQPRFPDDLETPATCKFPGLSHRP